MNRFFFHLLILIFLNQAVQVGAQSEVIENCLRGVVTVAVEKAQPIGKVLMGFRGNVVEEAYESSLKITNALGTGSGFVIERKGKKFIVTNAHVIESAADEQGSVYVYSYTRQKYEVKVVGGDSFYDLAVLEFSDPPGKELLPLEFAPALPKIAERVYAIGNPLGEYPYSVTDGIVSAVNRMREGITGKFGYIQSTATIIWGNSGGPLINERGEVVGVNSQIAFAEGPDGQTYLQQQLNFALEPALSNSIVNDIISSGRYLRSYLGVEFSQDFRIEQTARGSIIGRSRQNTPVLTGVIPESPAAKVLRPFLNREVTHINDVEVSNMEEVLGELEGIRPGSDCRMTFSGNEEPETVTIRTASLDQSGLTAIALFVLRQNRQVTLDESSAQVKLLMTGGGQDKKMKWDGELPNSKSPAQPVSFFMLAAGHVSGEGQDIWRITSLSDLGGLLKIYGLRGGIDYIVTTDPEDIQSARKVSQNFSEVSSYFRSVLWY
jgi:S1-C subfamily serine protease